MNQFCLLVLGRIYRVSQETIGLNFSYVKKIKNKTERYLLARRLAPRLREASLKKSRREKGHWWVETGCGGCEGLSRKSWWEKTPEDGL